MAQFPIGGKAKHYRSERFAIAAGSSQGIPKQGVKIPAVIFQDDFGIAIPLASGYITPGGSDTSMFEVIQWKNSDKDAMDIKKKNSMPWDVNMLTETKSMPYQLAHLKTGSCNR